MATRTGRVLGWVVSAWAAIFFVGAGFRVLADCSSFGLPFTDLGSTSFCAQIAEAYYSGLSNGTSATTYTPSANVPREQMAAFVTRTLDASLARGSRRAALEQWWNSTLFSLGATTVGNGPNLLKSDGADIWVANGGSASVSRVRASDGSVLGTWTGADGAFGVLLAMDRVFVTGQTTPGNLYMIDPTAVPGAVTTVTSSLGNSTLGIAFDGTSIWTANSGGGSVSIVTPGTWNVTAAAGTFTSPFGVLFDGTNIWVADAGNNTLDKLDSTGAILQSVSMGASSQPQFPVFDGHNIWVPNFGNSSLTVVRASDGVVLKTFSAGNGNSNGMSLPVVATFDGQRVLVTNHGNASVSLFQATTLSAIGSVAAPGLSQPYGACSDGASFWVGFASAPGKIGRF